MTTYGGRPWSNCSAGSSGAAGRGAAHRHEGRVDSHALAAAAEGAVLTGQLAPAHHKIYAISNACLSATGGQWLWLV